MNQKNNVISTNMVTLFELKKLISEDTEVLTDPKL